MIALPGGGQTPNPDPASVKKSLLRYKRLLTEVLKQLRLPSLDAEFDAAKVLRSDIELHSRDLKKVADEVKILSNTPGLELFLVSRDGLWQNIFDASGRLSACLISIDIIRAPTSKIKDRMDSAALLKEALEQSRDLLNDALSQFLI